MKWNFHLKFKEKSGSTMGIKINFTQEKNILVKGVLAGKKQKKKNLKNNDDNKNA